MAFLDGHVLCHPCCSSHKPSASIWIDENFLSYDSVSCSGAASRLYVRIVELPVSDSSQGVLCRYWAMLKHSDILMA